MGDAGANRLWQIGDVSLAQCPTRSGADVIPVTECNCELNNLSDGCKTNVVERCIEATWPVANAHASRTDDFGVLHSLGGSFERGWYYKVREREGTPRAGREGRGQQLGATIVWTRECVSSEQAHDFA